METRVETARLRREIERALGRAFDPVDVLPRLARLARLAEPGSDDAVFADRRLAELLVDRHPWRAAVHARRAIAHAPSDDRAWAVLAFCHTLLGNYRSAVRAYRGAIACAPTNPWYAHNLGHLLDVALGTPDVALPWLRAAYDATGANAEIVASFVHALARTGRTEEARAILHKTLARSPSRELSALLRWLDQRTPAARESRAVPDARRPAIPRERRSRTRLVPPSRRLARVLAQGLSHLPLDSMQRERALALASDALADRAARSDRSTSNDVADLAAAVAYAIVYVDHVPLSQAEVAAPFRVAVGRLRGRFAELRAELDLVKGDARYATTRG